MCFDLTYAPVETAAGAAATRPVSMSTWPGPEGSDTVDVVIRRCPRLRVLWDFRELTHWWKPRLWSLPPRLGQVTVYPTCWGVGPLIFHQSPPAREIIMYVLFAFNYHIPVHTTVLTFYHSLTAKEGRHICRLTATASSLGIYTTTVVQ